eukprot:4961236-Pyramimonas_sp.AAC.1
MSLGRQLPRAPFAAKGPPGMHTMQTRRQQHLACTHADTSSTTTNAVIVTAFALMKNKESIEC